MGKGSYSGGGTSIRLGDDGTFWGSFDQAEKQKSRPRAKRRVEHRTPTSKQIAIQAERDSHAERKILRNFISQCAAAHLKDSLTPEAPLAPASLRKRVKRAGGNVRWLEANRQYQIVFHEAFCRLLNRRVPFEEVWGPRGK
jgi:hypothetical protein